MAYYSAIERKERLSFATTCMNFESIMLNEISLKRKRKTNPVLNHLYVGFKNKTN